MNKMSLTSRRTEQSGKGRAIVIRFCRYSGKEMTFTLRNQGRQPDGGGILSGLCRMCRIQHKNIRGRT